MTKVVKIHIETSPGGNIIEVKKYSTGEELRYAIKINGVIDAYYDRTYASIDVRINASHADIFSDAFHEFMEMMRYIKALWEDKQTVKPKLHIPTFKQLIESYETTMTLINAYSQLVFTTWLKIVEELIEWGGLPSMKVEYNTTGGENEYATFTITVY